MIQIPPAIICIGRNWAEHAAEMSAAMPTRPTVFMKNPASVIGPGMPVIIPPVCAEGGPQVDWEGELAVIIGRDCREASEENALDFICGWAVALDITARWWQKEGSGGQWIRGKSFDTFCPISELAPADAIVDPQQLTIETRVNGKLMQSGKTADMIFPVASLIADLSRGMTLLKGTVILTGTPPGVGAARTPPVFLRDGDVVEVDIDGVGHLQTHIQDQTTCD